MCQFGSTLFNVMTKSKDRSDKNHQLSAFSLLQPLAWLCRLTVNVLVDLNTWRCLNKSNDDSTATTVSLSQDVKMWRRAEESQVTAPLMMLIMLCFMLLTWSSAFHTLFTFCSVSLGKRGCLEKYKHPACEWMLTWAVYTRLKWKIWRPLYEITWHRGLQLLNTAAAGWSRIPPNCWIKGQTDRSPPGGVQQGRSFSLFTDCLLVTGLYLEYLVYIVGVYIHILGWITRSWSLFCAPVSQSGTGQLLPLGQTVCGWWCHRAAGLFLFHASLSHGCWWHDVIDIE